MADAPHPRRSMEEPSKGGGGCLFRANPGQRRDVRPVKRLFRHHWPCAAIPATTTPSRALQHQPRRCGSKGRQDAATPAAVRLPAFRQPDPRDDARMTTREEVPTPPPSMSLLDGYRARRDAPPEAKFARTTVYSAALYAIPPHVGRTVRHACKTVSPWPISGGAVPWPQGDDG
jgi:hypothetical protein